jgi:hypothetical protein
MHQWTGRSGGRWHRGGHGRGPEAGSRGHRRGRCSRRSCSWGRARGDRLRAGSRGFCRGRRRRRVGGLRSGGRCFANRGFCGERHRRRVGGLHSSGGGSGRTCSNGCRWTAGRDTCSGRHCRSCSGRRRRPAGCQSQQAKAQKHTEDNRQRSHPAPLSTIRRIQSPSGTSRPGTAFARPHDPSENRIIPQTRNPVIFLCPCSQGHLTVAYQDVGQGHKAVLRRNAWYSGAARPDRRLSLDTGRNPCFTCIIANSFVELWRLILSPAAL